MKFRHLINHLQASMKRIWRTKYWRESFKEFLKCSQKTFLKWYMLFWQKNLKNDQLQSRSFSIAQFKRLLRCIDWSCLIIQETLYFLILEAALFQIINWSKKVWSSQSKRQTLNLIILSTFKSKIKNQKLIFEQILISEMTLRVVSYLILLKRTNLEIQNYLKKCKMIQLKWSQNFKTSFKVLIKNEKITIDLFKTN